MSTPPGVHIGRMTAEGSSAHTVSVERLSLSQPTDGRLAQCLVHSRATVLLLVPRHVAARRLPNQRHESGETGVAHQDQIGGKGTTTPCPAIPSGFGAVSSPGSPSGLPHVVPAVGCYLSAPLDMLTTAGAATIITNARADGWDLLVAQLKGYPSMDKFEILSAASTHFIA